MRKSVFALSCGAALVYAALSFSSHAALAQQAAPAHKAAAKSAAKAAPAAKAPAVKAAAAKAAGNAAPAAKPADKSEPAATADEKGGFVCTAIENIGKIDINADGVHINNVRARAIAGIDKGFNLFQVSYQILNTSPQKIWVSGEFVFGFDGHIAGALSAAGGLDGVLPNESALIKGTVLSSDVFFQTQNICFRFNVENQKGA